MQKMAGNGKASARTGKLRLPLVMVAATGGALLLLSAALVTLMVAGPINRTQLDQVAVRMAEGYARAINVFLATNQAGLERLLQHPDIAAAIRRSPQANVVNPQHWREAFAEALSLTLIPLGPMATADPEFDRREFNHTEQAMIAQAARGEAVPPEVTPVNTEPRITLVGAIRSSSGQILGVGILNLRFSAMNKLLVKLADLGDGNSGRLTLLQVNDPKQPLVLADLGSGDPDAGEHTVAVPGSRNWQLRFTPSTAFVSSHTVDYWMLAGFYLLALAALIIALMLALRSISRTTSHDVQQLLSFIDGRFEDRSFPRPALAITALEPIAEQVETVLHRLLARRPDMPAAADGDTAVVAPPAAVGHAPATGTPLRADSAPVGRKEATPGQIFRAYDIRGIVNRDLDGSVIYDIGQAVGSMALEAGESRVLVARDGRLSSPQLTDRLIQGLLDTGLDVGNLGAIPTPVLYFATHRLDVGTALMVTGSHNPPDYNGVKILMDKRALTGAEIQAVRRRILDRNFHSGMGSYEATEIRSAYLDAIFTNITAGRSLKVVVDCGNGIAGSLAPQMLEELGCDVVPLYCDVDGSFPHHHPDPGVPANLADLIQRVRAEGADLGVAFDGDGDRLGAVTGAGAIVPPDHLLLIFARQVLADNPGGTVVFDVKCSAHLAAGIASAGGDPVMWKSGHSLIKQRMAELGAPLGGEYSGHFCFADRWYGFDDGLYAAARLIEILSTGRHSLAELMTDMPTTVTTPELVLPVSEESKFAIVQAVVDNAAFGAGTVNTLDGIRVDYADGWGLLRASNTGPNLILRFEAEDRAALERIRAVFSRALAAVSPELGTALDAIAKANR